MSKNTNDYEGYKEQSIEILKKFDAKTWSKIKITNEGKTIKGTILPRNKFAEDGWVDLKLKDGYNIGIELTPDTQIEVLERKPPMEVKFEQKAPKKNKKLPDVMLLGTGGTIASRLDYATGGVIPAFEPGELFAAVPELSDICNLETEVVYKMFSEDMKPEYWLKMAKRVAEVANSGVNGIMIGHGTDTMAYTSAALSFLLNDLTVPVVVVGSQRSSDRPSSDAALNLVNAATVAANADLAEVVICMLGSTNHDYGLIHRGTRVRKMHSSVRHTFRTIGQTPLGYVQDGKIQFFEGDKTITHRPPKSKNKMETIAAYNIEEKVGLIYSYPGMPTDLVDYYVDKGYKGLVLAGTGLGHFPHDSFDSLQRAHEEGVHMVMTVQTLWGYTGMDVYETGREIQDLGVIPGKNMLPEVAVAKLAWLLGNYDDPQEIDKLIATNIKGEILPGEPLNGFQLYQGVEERIKTKLKNLKLE